MIQRNNHTRGGYSAVELLVVVAVVVIFVSAFAVHMFKMIDLQEKDREAAYVRERLSDICGLIADQISIGSSVNTSDSGYTVEFRKETCGINIDFNWGTIATNAPVRHVARAIGFESILDEQSISNEIRYLEYVNPYKYTNVSRRVSGDSSLVGRYGGFEHKMFEGVEIISNKLHSLHLCDGAVDLGEGAVRRLELCARYSDDFGANYKTVTVERLVRLWNR